MRAAIHTKKIGTKWHGTIEGRPDIDETALSEEAVRRKMEQLRDKIGPCGAWTNLFGGRTCELIAGHQKPNAIRTEHRSGTVTWFEVSEDEP
jgi:predicted nucleic acid-binding Zn ribbon protein